MVWGKKERQKAVFFILYLIFFKNCLIFYTFKKILEKIRLKSD